MFIDCCSLCVSGVFGVRCSLFVVCCYVSVDVWCLLIVVSGLQFVVRCLLFVAMYRLMFGVC